MAAVIAMTAVIVIAIVMVPVTEITAIVRVTTMTELETVISFSQCVLNEFKERLIDCQSGHSSKCEYHIGITMCTAHKAPHVSFSVPSLNCFVS